MTNEAIILLDPENNGESNQLLFEEVNGKPFLHYQLSYLADNLFKHIIFIHSDLKNELLNFFGTEYLGIKITYLEWNEEAKSGGNIYRATELIEDIFVFVFDALHYFRLNFRKADDFRRMRDSKLLFIGRKAEEISNDQALIFLNEKGLIKDIKLADHLDDDISIPTQTWLINKIFFKKQFEKQSFSLYEDYFKNEYKKTPLYCLACRQYHIQIQNYKDIEKARDEFAAHYYQ